MMESERLAAEYSRMTNYLHQESRIALLKIQSWQFAMRTPEVGPHYQSEATRLVKDSLLNYISNSFVLQEEGYFNDPIVN